MNTSSRTHLILLALTATLALLPARRAVSEESATLAPGAKPRVTNGAGAPAPATSGGASSTSDPASPSLQGHEAPLPAGPPAPLCGPIDQSQLSALLCMSTLGQADLAQSFTTNATALCAARVDLQSGTGASGITIELWDDLPNAGGTLLASGSDPSVPDGGAALVSFGSVPVTPGRQYFLVFTGTNPGACLAGDTSNPYLGGNVFANSGYVPYPEFDYTFETYGPQVHPCGPPDQTQASDNTCMATLGQVDLAQSFVTDATSLCGASVEISVALGARSRCGMPCPTPAARCSPPARRRMRRRGAPPS